MRPHSFERLLLRALFGALLVLAQAACSDDAATDGASPATGPGDTGGVGGPGVDAGSGDAAQVVREVASMETIASPEHVQAGLEVTITCVPLDAEGTPIEGIDTNFTVNGPGPYHIVEDHASFELVGTYNAACHTSDGAFVDETPEVIEVVAGAGTVVQTTLSAHEVTAGDTVAVTCEIHDAFGNLNEDAPTEIWAKPGDGWAAFGMNMKTIASGSFDVACRIKDTGVKDETPESLLVEVGLPRRIVTTLEPDTIEAGGTSKVSCKAVDAYGNTVPNFPISLNIPAAVSIEGLALTTVIAGNYAIKCVPETDAWDLYEIDEAVLHVMPGPPYELYVQQIPAMPVYRKNDTLELVVQVLDGYGNLVPDATLLPITINPPTGVKVVDPKTFTFKEEGKYIFHLEVLDYPAVAEDLQILVDGQGPVLVIEKPSRAETVTGKPAVNVTGHVDDEIAGVTALTVNGYLVDVKGDSTFTHIMLANQGMNPIVAEATDLGGKVSHTTRAFTYSTEWYPVDASTPEVGRVKKGLQVWLGKNFLDDGDHNPNDPNDLATIIETLVGSLDLSSVVPSPAAESGPYKIYLKNLSFSKPVVSLVPFDGGLTTKVTIGQFKVKIEAIGKCKILFIDVCPDVKGWVTADAIVIKADVLAGTVNEQTNISIGAVDVTLDDLDIDISGILGSLFDWLIDWMVGSFTGQIEDAFESQLGGTLTDAITSLLESFAISEAIEIPPVLGAGDPVTLQIGTKIGLIEFSPEGGLVGLDASIITTKKIAQDPLGSIGRASCGKGKPEYFELDKEMDIGFALHDDFINQALYSVWYGGLLNGPVDPAMLGDLGSLADQGISDLSITTLLFGAPLLTSCNPGQQLKIQVPDAYAEIGLKLASVPLDLGVFVSLEIEASLVVVETATEKQIGVELGGLTLFNIEIVSITAGWEEAIPDLEQLFKDKLVEALAGSIEGQQLGAFPIPEIDLSTLDPSIPAGTVLKLNLADLIRDAGYTSINAQVE